MVYANELAAKNTKNPVHAEFLVAHGSESLIPENEAFFLSLNLSNLCELKICVRKYEKKHKTCLAITTN